MKSLLSLLLCFVFLHSQALALSGGPVFPGASVSVTGTYAGVLIPSEARNSIGLFSLGVPDSGLASGNAFIFSLGRAFRGTISGFADPGTATISGVIETRFAFNILLPKTTTTDDGTTTEFVSQAVTSDANGTLQATIVPAVRAFTTAATRLTGTATIDLSTAVSATTFLPIIDETIEMIVSGIKQSESVVETGGAAAPF